MHGYGTSLNTEMTMMAALRSVAGSRLSQEALVCGDERVSYGELLRRVEGLMRGLWNVGIRKGDKVAVMLPPGLEFAYTFFALAGLGAVIVPLDPKSRRRSLSTVLRDAEPAALVTSRPISVLQEDVGREDDRISGLRHVIYVGAADPGSLSLVDLIHTPGVDGVLLPEIVPQDLLALLYTSGTTGAPKGTMHSHRSLIAPVVASTKLRELWLRRPSLKTMGNMAKALIRYRERLLRAAGRPQVLLSTVGWHTITGLEVMLQALLMGDRLVVMPRFHPREAMRLVEGERVTVLIAVPMAFQVMLGLQDFGRYDTCSLLICGTGAAPCSPDLAQQMQERFGCAVHIGFGATEVGGGIAATSLADSSRRQAETVGRPMPGTEIRIVDERRLEVPVGQIGELACRSDSVMLGYYRAPESTAEVIDEDGWYYTGDLARVDADGYIHIVGRQKDVIIRGGQNVYPDEIEAYLVAHPRIREAAVVGVPSSVGGESMWAFVLLEEGAQMTTRQVADYCRAELEPFKIPSRIRFVAELPRSVIGKPQKFRLREAISRGEYSGNNTGGGESR